MKFGKEFSSQMVSEWHQAYMDYNQLKSLLKEIIKHKHKTNPKSLNRKLTLHRAFSGLISKHHHHHGGHISHLPESDDDIEEGVKVKLTKTPILVNTLTHGYETTFLMAAEEGGEYETVFFRRLDEEFNKVERFYREKVEEVMREAVLLDKQMDALIAFRVKVEVPDEWRFEERTVEMRRLNLDVDDSVAVVGGSTPARARSSKLTNSVSRVLLLIPVFI